MYASAAVLPIEERFTSPLEPVDLGEPREVVQVWLTRSMAADPRRRRKRMAAMAPG